MNAVDLKELVDLLDMCGYSSFGEPHHGYVQRSTGQIFFFSAENIARAEENEPIDDLPDWHQEIMLDVKKLVGNWDDFVELEPMESWESYQIMEAFCEQVHPERDRERLLYKIEGKGAFSRFRDEVYRLGIEQEWYAWKERCLKEHVRKWCIREQLRYRDSSEKDSKIVAFE